VPDHTQTDKTLLYQTYDVTRLVRAGKANVIGAELGRGWTGVNIPGEWYWSLQPSRTEPSILARLVVKHANGSTETIVSDTSWKTTDGPSRFDSVYTGEKYDARVAQALSGWDTAGYDDTAWTAATQLRPVGSCTGTRPAPCHGVIPSTGATPAGFVAAALKAQENEPVQVRRTLPITRMVETFPGSKVWIFDLGSQIHAGWYQLNLTGITADKAGRTLRLLADQSYGGAGTAASPYAISSSNNFLDGYLQTDFYTLSAAATQTWAPRFHYNGQRYVEIRGLEDVLGRAPSMATDAGLLVAQVASSGFNETGEWDSDNALLDRIKEMSNWTQRNNAHHKPTDTPSREKNGWTGDAWADEEAWMNDFDVSKFYEKWMRDIADSLISTGEMPEIAPAAKGGYGYDATPGWNNTFGPTPAWDAAFWETPWDLYRYYGNVDLLRELYPAQKKAMDYYATKLTPANNFAGPRGTLAEYAAGTGGGGSSNVINAQLYYRFADLMARQATLLGNSADATAFRAKADEILRNFIATYWDDTAHAFIRPPLGNIQTEQTMAIAFDMVPGSDLAPPPLPRRHASPSGERAQRRRDHGQQPRGEQLPRRRGHLRPALPVRRARRLRLHRRRIPDGDQHRQPRLGRPAQPRSDDAAGRVGRSHRQPPLPQLDPHLVLPGPRGHQAHGARLRQRRHQAAPAHSRGHEQRPTVHRDEPASHVAAERGLRVAEDRARAGHLGLGA